MKTLINIIFVVAIVFTGYVIMDEIQNGWKSHVEAVR